MYDSLGRPSIVGTSINSVLYNMSVGYDTSTGRVTNVQFPSTVAGFGNFAFYNNYDAKGFLTAVSSLANNGGTKKLETVSGLRYCIIDPNRIISGYRACPLLRVSQLD